MKSIRQYLQSRVTWGSSVILAAGSVLIGFAIYHLDIREFDDALETKARTLATLVLREDRAIEVDFAGEFMPEFETAENTEYFEFRLLDGSVIERSDMLGERDLPFLPHAAGAPVFGNLRLPDGRAGRFVQIAFPPREIEPQEPVRNVDRFHVPEGSDPDAVRIILSVARSRMGLDDFLRKTYLALAAVDVLLVGLIALLVREALHKGFKPLKDLNNQIACLGPETLSNRIHLPDPPAEIAVFPATINSVMEALQAAFVRERRFASDAAHELRTPVAEFRAACEVGAKWSDDPVLVNRRFENLRSSAANMERMLNGLLDLSLLERGSAEVHYTDVRLAALVDSCWSRVSRDGGGGTRLDNRIEQALILRSDEAKLDMLLYNLLDNAASYSPHEATVICEGAQTADGAWEMIISNPVQGLLQKDIEHVFERFWRMDAARTGGTHAGLGLSIVKALADALGIRVTVKLTPDDIFTMRLDFRPADIA